MPALSTTKRKFHAILESIANPSTTSLNSINNQQNASTTTLSAAHEPAAKRLKFSRPVSAPGSSTLTRSVRSTSTTTNPPTSTASTMTEEKKPPNFAPWDRNQFLARLETFRYVDKWMSKPDPINEVQWAKRGWTCVGNEKVGCIGGCGNEILISLEPSREEQQPAEDIEPSEDAVDDYYDWREEAQKELVVRYSEMIVTEHDGGCLWRRRGCDGIYFPSVSLRIRMCADRLVPDSIYRLPLAHQAITFQSLRQRYESLSAISSDLPSNISAPSNLNIHNLIPHLFHILHPNLKNSASASHPSSPIIPNLPQPDDQTSPSPPTINRRALTLALLGWAADDTSPVPGIATCSSCFRRLGLWLFKTPPSSPITSPPSSPTSASSPAHSTPIIARLDPITEHRTYCPWVNARSQSRSPNPTPEDLPGWEILRDMIMRIRTPEGVKVPGYEGGGDKAREGEAAVGGMDGVEEKSKEERDRERWARLKKIKQIFRLRKKPKVGDGEKAKGKEKAPAARAG
ncbi:MAG: hypothetical protein LQ344_000035 [Seirophora lacunosa]|nr:MAG: hypothetical protein LQ344_000035 [Seirophora lacunosa]